MLQRLRSKTASFENYIYKLQKDKRIVGLSIAIVYDDNIVYKNGFGKTDIKSSKNVDENTILSIQSITKSFAATSIMRLVEKGLINIDNPLIEYLPYFRTKNKSQSDKITVKQLLSHTAGFPKDIHIANIISPNISEFKGIDSLYEKSQEYSKIIESINTFEDITRYFENINLSYEPGRGWSYCTDAYAIVGDLFEKVSETSWDEYVENEIFKSIGMERTTLDPIQAQNDFNSCKYYIEKNNNLIEVPFPTNPIVAPIGFIYSTAHDMAKYLAAHMKYGYSPILTSKGIGRMQIPVSEICNNTNDNFKWLKDAGYGLGWFIGHYKGQRIVGHSGGYPGVRASVVMVPGKKLGVVALSNFERTDSGVICQRAIDIMLNDE
ncbi:serine hydrolase domain-containing protein [Sporosalibacterium faouarense]|uniref:serine hydrolase domain-containing protein n=1 Tax=Sporosalibacterium faouarense TaxID=516123 RepID=UPI00192BED07|nr:serine hydrolase domain-containing protein [Sporosalibacterium faouarense]